MADPASMTEDELRPYLNAWMNQRMVKPRVRDDPDALKRRLDEIKGEMLVRAESERDALRAALTAAVPFMEWAAELHGANAKNALDALRDALSAPSPELCATCGGTGFVDGWPLPGGGEVITEALTAENANQWTRVQHRCPACSAPSPETP